MQVSIKRNFDTETPQQREAHSKARRVRYDVELATNALSKADNTPSDLNRAAESVELSRAYVRVTEAYGYNHFNSLSGSMAKENGQLQSLEAKGVHQYEWLELSPPACSPYQMGAFDVSYRRDGHDEVYRSGTSTVRVNQITGTLTITDQT